MNTLNRNRRSNRPAPLIEALESRQLLSAAIANIAPLLAAPNSALHLVFTQQPMNGVAGEQLNGIIEVSIEDAGGNVVAGNDQVTLSVQTAPPGGELHGTTTVSSFSGVAEFGNLWLSANGVYTLLASDPNADAAVSAPFTITTQAAVISVTSSNIMPAVGQTFAISAAVSPANPYSQTPTGTVTFSWGPQTFGSATIANGVVSLSVSYPAAGAYGQISATYNGDSVFAPISATSSFQEVAFPVPPIRETLTGGLPRSTLVTGQPNRLNQRITLVNTNSARFQDAMSGELYLSTDTTVNSAAIQLGSVLSTSVNLRPRGRAAFSFKLDSIPTSVPAGIYHLVVHMSGGSIGASTVAGSAKTITVATPVRSLDGVIKSVPFNTRTEKPTSVALFITNHGNVPAAGKLDFNFYVSTMPTLGRGASYLGPTPLASIRIMPGTSRLVRVSPIVLTQNPGDYYFFAEVDPSRAFNDNSPINGAVGPHKIHVKP